MSSKSKIVIFDIGNTLTQVSKFKSFLHFGSINNILHIFKYFTRNKRLSFEKFHNKVTNFYIEFLSKIPSIHEFENYELRTINGKPMPSLQRDNLLGKLSSKECLDIANKWLHENKNVFANKQEYEIFKKILHFNFEPEIFIKSQKPTKCMDLLKKSYEKKDKNGNRKNFIIILSNIACEILPHLKKYFPEIYEFSDIQLFSCEQGYLKPNKQLFEQCLSFRENEHSKIFYIDDEIFQRQVANEMGIIAIDPNNAELILKEFEVI